MRALKALSQFRRKTGAVLAGMVPGAVLAASAAWLPAADACTSFVLNTTDNTTVYARSMEFPVDMKSRLVGIPEGMPLTGQKSLAWEAKYAVIGMNAYGMPAMVDGINEKGLAGGILYFPGFAGYTDPQAVGPGEGLAPWEFLTWALTNFATVDEIKAALPHIRVMNITLPQMGMAPPVHYTLHDASGKSIVIEPVDGVLKVYDNPLGVMTNAPGFDWQMTNLRNYANLTPVDVSELKINNATVRSLGAGSGLHGIPGDQTPPSRFVRVSAMVLSAHKPSGGLPGVRMAEHIINNFDIPKGLVQAKEGTDFTQWSSVADTGQKRYYIKTWDNPVLSGVGFDDFTRTGKTMVNFAVPKDTPPTVLKPDDGA